MKCVVWDMSACRASIEEIHWQFQSPVWQKRTVPPPERPVKLPREVMCPRQRQKLMTTASGLVCLGFIMHIWTPSLCPGRAGRCEFTEIDLFECNSVHFKLVLSFVSCCHWCLCLPTLVSSYTDLFRIWPKGSCFSGLYCRKQMFIYYVFNMKNYAQSLVSS